MKLPKDRGEVFQIIARKLQLDYSYGMLKWNRFCTKLTLLNNWYNQR